MSQLTLDLNRLKAERIACGLTQEQLAKQVGHKRAWYAKRESGIVDIGADELAVIANALGIQSLDIFFKKNVPEKQRNK